MNKLAILYAAKSTADTRQSIPTQLNDSREIAEREGFEVVGGYSDEAKSAYSGNRGPGLTAAKDHAARLAVDGHEVAIFIQHSDRIARGDGVSAPQVIQHVWDAKRDGYSYRSVQDDASFSDESGLHAFLMGVRNHEDSKRKSAAVAAGKRRAALRGEPHGGWSPYGYRFARWEDGVRGLIVVPEQEEIVKRIFREWRQGKAQKQIARDLNRDGVPPMRARMWQQSSVGRLLRNPAYAGLRDLEGDLLSANHPPLIPRDEWEEAQRLLSPKGTKKRSGRPGVGFMLRGLLICGECGAPLHCDRGKKPTSQRYVCYTREKNPDACSQRGWRRADLDEGVLEYFEHECLDVEASWQAYREAADSRVAETRAFREQAEREAMRLAERLDRTDEDYGSGDLPAADYQRLRRKWQDERDAALAEIERLSAHEDEIANAASPNFIDRFVRVREAVANRLHGIRDDEGVEAVRAALRSLFESFVVYDAPTALGAVLSFRLVPRLREDVATGRALIPGQRVPISFPPEEDDKYHVAEALSYRSPVELCPA